MHALNTYKIGLQCNNPLTKEPKLTSAVRIVPEWTSYDTEIKQLQDQVASLKGDITDSPGKKHCNIVIHFNSVLFADPNDFNDIWNHIKHHEEL